MPRVREILWFFTLGRSAVRAFIGCIHLVLCWIRRVLRIATFEVALAFGSLSRYGELGKVYLVVWGSLKVFFWGVGAIFCSYVCHLFMVWW